jgi:hypothetical protein
VTLGAARPAVVLGELHLSRTPSRLPRGTIFIFVQATFTVAQFTTRAAGLTSRTRRQDKTPTDSCPVAACCAVPGTAA